MEICVRDYEIPWIMLRLCNPGGLQRDFIDSEGLLRDHMDYEKLLRDFMDSKCKSRDYRNTKLYTCIYIVLARQINSHGSSKHTS